jgi:hypothetical protein
VRCVGVFDSDPLGRDYDPDLDWSSLVIVWFQKNV